MTKDHLDCIAMICRNRNGVSEVWMGNGRFFFRRRGVWWAAYVSPTLGVMRVVESVDDINWRLEHINLPLHHYEVET